jgi:hypothetical protein
MRLPLARIAFYVAVCFVPDTGPEIDAAAAVDAAAAIHAAAATPRSEPLTIASQAALHHRINRR